MHTHPRTILISGASRGIGAALARLRYERGDRLILLSRSEARGDWDPQRVQQHRVDLSCAAQLAKTLKSILSTHPKLDTVISNAGEGGAIAHIEQLSPSQIEASMRTNLLSHMWLAKGVWSTLRGQERADLIFTGSEAALAGSPRGSVYCAAKFGLRGFAQSLRAEAVGSSLRVGIIHPGPVSSSFFDDLDFEPAKNSEASTAPHTVAEHISWMLDAPQDCVIDEMVVSPRKRQFRKKRPTGRSPS